MATQVEVSVTVRRARPEDAHVCGEICYRAFNKINTEHNFPCDFPNPEAPIGLLSMMFSLPSSYAVVAECDGRLVGSNVLDERSNLIKGIGPITVDPDVQNAGIGRRLMQSVLDRAAETGSAGVRLVQAAFHNRSLSLYTRLGFDVREPLACLQGQLKVRQIPGCSVRPATMADLEACNALSYRVHGFDRGAELAAAIGQGTAFVVERGGRITGYSSSLAFFGHGTTETNTDLMALLASANGFGGPGLLLPTRNSEVFRWCLANGLRVVQPMTLMTMGLYNEPKGAWFPSVLF